MPAFQDENFAAKQNIPAMKKHEKTVPKLWEILLKFHHIAGFFLVALVIVAVYITRGFNRNAIRVQIPFQHDEKTIINGCDLFSGKWIYDETSYHPYKEESCSFLKGSLVDCQTNGRKDVNYLKWRWQPYHCDLPRFDGKAFLEKIKGKKLIYVGDSLNRNQWYSMLCLIESSLPPSSNIFLVTEGNMRYIQASEYNATIGFYWSPFLVESNSDNATSHRVQDRAIRIKAIEKHARHWTDADILIFDSFIWWIEPQISTVWGSFGSPDAIYKTIPMTLRHFDIALGTWSDWLEININRTRTKMYFMSLSPFHCRGKVSGTYQHCYNQTEPILKEGLWGCASRSGMMNVVESTLEKLQKRGVQVQYVNVTKLSGYRKDAHPSIYKRFNQELTEEQKKNPQGYADCIHWCLPGVPDVWNQFLYAYIMYPEKYV